MDSPISNFSDQRNSRDTEHKLVGLTDRKSGNLTADVKPIPSSSLLRDRKTIVIDHEGELYQLRVTKNNRLILTK